MTKYLVTLKSFGFGEFGNPRTTLACDEVDPDELLLSMEDAVMLAEGEMVENPVKRMVLEVSRI